MALSYVTFEDGRAVATPVSIGDVVLVHAYGYGARRADVRRVGTVQDVHRTRAVVTFDDYEGGRRDIAPECLRLVSRQER